jgi:hypothetical protein
MKKYYSHGLVAACVLAMVGFAMGGSGCKGGAGDGQDSVKVVQPASFHAFFSHHGYLDEGKAFFAPSTMKTHKVKTAKFYDHFAGKPDFAKDLPDEIKHLDTEGRVVKEEFLAIDSASYAYGSESWTYDAQGRVVSSTIVYPNSTKSTKVEYAYDGEGRLRRIGTHVMEGDSIHSRLVQEISYGGKGNIPSKIVHAKNDTETGSVTVQWKGDSLVYEYKGEEDMVVRFILDAEGRVKEMVEVDRLPEAFQKKHVFRYDAAARVNGKDEHAWLNGQYVLVNTTLWSYDAKGLLTGEEVYALKGEVKTLVDKSLVEYGFYE